jgi:choline dehydrogenase-like flavoprotein
VRKEPATGEQERHQNPWAITATFVNVLTDGRGIPANTVFIVDLCIIGTGPAGLAITHELTGSGFQILLIERGDVTDELAADLTSDLEFESPHFLFPQGTLHNQFGGMAAIWKTGLLGGAPPAARYLPLDPIDFETRYWVPHSGWPITFDQMAPYYDRARMLCGIESFDFHGPLPETDRIPLSSPSGELVTRLDQSGPATAFTSRPLVELTRSDQVHVVTNAIAVELTSADGTDDGMATTSVRTPGGVPFTIRSRVVVVAGGAIESARLLLNSTAQYSTGLGNHFDNVGRFFMEHPRVSLSCGSFSPKGSTRALDLYEPHILDGQLVVGKLKLSETVLRREELLNGNAYIVPKYRWSLSQLEGARSARIAVNSIKRRQGLTRVPKHLAMATRHAPSLARHSLNRYLNRPEVPVRDSEKRTGMVARSFELIYQPEQAPNRANRVTLSQRRDALGYRIAHLYWRWSEIDLLSIRRVRRIFASELRASGLADLVQAEGDIFPRGESNMSPETAHHLLGTTRMHDLPRHGVVDRVCRVHGSSSVYVAGASVFPTGGYANPTLTVVALAIRLADELKRIMSTA